jgi:hypothetical protein
MYADLHCHPGKAAYDTFVDKGLHNDPVNPWHIPQSNLEAQSKGRSTKDYSQCDLAKSTQARVKLMFAALYPIEKGFFYGVKDGPINKPMVCEFFKRVHVDGRNSAQIWLLGQIKPQPGRKNIKGYEIEFFLSHFERLPLERIQFLQNGHYDYFEELKREYKFFLSTAGKKAVTPKLQLEPHGPSKIWQGAYQLTQNGNEVLQRLRPDNDDVVIVFSIEGIHALGIGNPEDELAKPGDELKDVSIGKLKSRIRQLKGEEGLDDPTIDTWVHRPFFITFAHHFNNTLCGHAQSLPSHLRLLCDQRHNMDKGILKNAAYGVMRELLGLDDKNKCNGSKRILIDVKHMSAASRQDFYKNIIRPYNRKPENTLSKIPVIASQVGYSGIDSLEELIKNTRAGREADNFQVQGFKAWSINLCDEDVIEIHHSGGLIGITLDQHLLGFYQKSWLLDLPISERKRTRAILARTLAQFIHIPFDYHLSEPAKIWDMICIGSGFDGSSNPINGYTTVLDMHRLEDDLISILTRLKMDCPKWFELHSPEILARKICFENAYDFVVRHYH